MESKNNLVENNNSIINNNIINNNHININNNINGNNNITNNIINNITLDIKNPIPFLEDWKIDHIKSDKLTNILISIRMYTSLL